MKERSKVIFVDLKVFSVDLKDLKDLKFLIHKKQLLIIYLHFRLRISMKTIATIDLKNIGAFYEQIKVEYPEYSARFPVFLATSLYLDPDINLETAFKLRPYGGLRNIDSSSLDT